MRVACCGLTTLDVVQCTDRFPAPDEKLQATSTLMEFGGPAANALKAELKKAFAPQP